LKKRISRYLAYNQSRIDKAVSFNSSQANLLFKIIPFLLHSNFPDLPGYVAADHDRECPCGIHHYQPEKRVDPDLFQRYFPHSAARHIKTPDLHHGEPCIHSLKTIGSIGTVAQSEISDCDYWLSIRRQEMGSRGVEMLEQKCRGIEEWAAKRGIEVHFFLMDIDQIRENNFQSLTEKDSAGSAIQALLKDELFRTHILVAGKMLLWWLIPPGLSEEEYRRYVRTLHQSGKAHPDYFIDLGYLSDIPKAEIFGACLWQMNKALDSPFKSVIKFAYLDILLKNDAQSLPLFSDKIKCLITFPEQSKNEMESMLALTEIDPYLLMAREITAFYRQEKTEQRRDNFIRECLYLKALEGMQSRQTAPGQADRLAAILKLMKEWDLLPDNYEHFTGIRTWKYKEKLDFGIKIHDYLIETYKRLRWLFKNFGEETPLAITQRDLSVLGRKLFTFYEKKPDKIDYIRGISRKVMAQREITFHINRFEGVDYYYAFQGMLDAAGIKTQADCIIRRESEPTALIAWLVINGIINKDTRLHLTKNFLPIDLVDLQQLVQLMLKVFPPVFFERISSEQLLREEEIIRALVVVNMGKTPVKGAKTLASVVITINSYGEYFIHSFNTLTQLKNMLRLLLTRYFISRWNNNLETFIPNQPESYYLKNLLSQ
jgi:adenylate cyclase, class 1